jgi:glycosyltransferase involved in cell wall biosynthesis
MEGATIGVMRGNAGAGHVDWAFAARPTSDGAEPTYVADSRRPRLDAASSPSWFAIEEAEARPTVSVVIPTLNEAENLPHVLPYLPREYEVLIVDGASVDRTTAVAPMLRPSVRVIEQTGRGKGNALACGFAAAKGEIIVMLDADGSAKVDEIPRFVEALCSGADFAKGSRFLGDGGSADITPLRRLGNRLLSGLVNLLFGTRYTDLCYGYNAFWASCLPHLRIDCDGFEVETQLNIRACKAGLCVVEVPSFEERRIHGASNLHAVRDGLAVLRTILAERFSRKGNEALVLLSPEPQATSSISGG